jgi:hypothetical protein
LKASSATSARAATAVPRRTAQSSAKRPPTPTSGNGFALSGPSDLPDPGHNAYRKDLADVALAGRVIASHYAEPLKRVVTAPATLRDAPAEDASVIGQLQPGQRFELLDDSLGWAWGYAGKEKRVGYVRSDALSNGGV